MSHKKTGSVCACKRERERERERGFSFGRQGMGAFDPLATILCPPWEMWLI